jgi:hypothetical protein
MAMELVWEMTTSRVLSPPAKTYNPSFYRDDNPLRLCPLAHRCICIICFRLSRLARHPVRHTIGCETAEC